MAGLLNQNPYGGGLLGRPQPQGLLGGIANFFRPWTPEDRARVAAVMPPDLAPTQIVKGMVGGAADLAMQANQAMPWGGNYPQAIGIDPQAGTIDPSKMIPFATDVAGMATTGSLAAPGVAGGVGMGMRAKLPPAPKPDISGWRVENITQPDYYSTNRNVRIIAPDGRVASQRSPPVRYTDEQLILDHLGYKEPPPPPAKPTLPPVQIKDAPELEAPDVNWRGSDLADDGTAASIMKSYGRGKGQVVSGYVDIDTIPLPKGAGISKDGLPTERGGYGWDELQRRGSPPPLKIRIDKNGKVTLMDGNHRLAFWRDRGFSEVPVYAIDERPVTGGRF